MLYRERGESSIRFRRSQSVYLLSSDDYVRRWVRRELVAHGVTPFVFESATDYLACEKADTPACIVLDVMLADMSGLDLQRRLAGACPPIIFATRRAEFACSVQAMKQGALDFLAVPFGSQALLRSVHDALELDRVSRERRGEVTGMRERFDRLTPREREVMRLIVDGLPNKRVASVLGISQITVQIHRGRIKQKMEARSLAELVRAAIELGVGGAVDSRPWRDAPQNARRTSTLKYCSSRSYGTPVTKLDSISL